MRLGCDMMLTDEQRTFVVAQRRAVLATLSTSGNPHMVPICSVLAARPTDASRVVLYSPLDEKPKQAADVRQAGARSRHRGTTAGLSAVRALE